ncbi:hypothetical protein [Spiroplasma sp. BIUS-1]|uniref:hypothetical protein n=1 Tax=Spiroplasma sp. BIUS-1 TaxID=216964 RepID=UPI001397D0E7|nr:hypothetical protein [Spiroplasma sp. BIUS-1]QHX36713.1 hypothetical protein SBIUS_v1c04600 [Spiroplasma sp. BIUS-1]
MKLGARKRNWADFIIYGAIFILLSIFFITPSVSVLRDKFDNSDILIAIKIIVGLVGILAILVKYIKGYTEFITNLDINKNNVSTLKWTLRKNNLIAFLKTTLSITPFLVFAIIQGMKLNKGINIESENTILGVPYQLKFMGMGLNNNVDNGFLLNFINAMLNNNEWISFGISLIFLSIIASTFLMGLIYVIYKISMNKYFKEINKTFRKISLNVKTEKELKYFDNFEEVMIENESKEISFQNERNLHLYAILDVKESDFWKELKKATTPPHFNF